MKLRLGIAIISLGFVITGFQNCAKTDFSSAGSPQADSSPKNGEVRILAEDDSREEDREEEVRDRDDDSQCDRFDQGKSSDLVVCILEGPGTSMKLGLENGSLAGGNSSRDHLCIPKSTCLNAVADVMPVKGTMAKYCKNSRNVLRLTDAEVREMLADL